MPKGKYRPISPCHPEVKYHARGMCDNCYARAVRTPTRVRAANLKCKYGILPADYQRLWESQRGLCAICTNPLSRNAPIDHDHKTGKIRGLLCSACNVFMSKVDKQGLTKICARLFFYVETWPATSPGVSRSTGTL